MHIDHGYRLLLASLMYVDAWDVGMLSSMVHIDTWDAGLPTLVLLLSRVVHVDTWDVGLLTILELLLMRPCVLHANRRYSPSARRVPLGLIILPSKLFLSSLLRSTVLLHSRHIRHLQRSR